LKNPSISGTDQGTSVKPGPRIRELVSYFLRLGTLGFGGPVALCGLMEKELVQDRCWLTKEEMRDAIAVSQSLPGPLAIQVGIFAAYLRGGFWGASAGGWAFILPRLYVLHMQQSCQEKAAILSVFTGCPAPGAPSANPENRVAGAEKFGGYSPQSDRLLERYDHEMDYSRKS
jgi:Chromate transporter